MVDYNVVSSKDLWVSVSETAFDDTFSNGTVLTGGQNGITNVNHPATPNIATGGGTGAPDTKRTFTSHSVTTACVSNENTDKVFNPEDFNGKNQYIAWGFDGYANGNKVYHTYGERVVVENGDTSGVVSYDVTIQVRDPKGVQEATLAGL